MNSDSEDIYTGQVASKSTSKWSGNVYSKLKANPPSNFLKDYRALVKSFPRASPNPAHKHEGSSKVENSPIGERVFFRKPTKPVFVNSNYQQMKTDLQEEYFFTQNSFKNILKSGENRILEKDINTFWDKSGQKKGIKGLDLNWPSDTKSSKGLSGFSARPKDFYQETEGKKTGFLKYPLNGMDM